MKQFLGHILNLDVLVLTYNTWGVTGTPAERTRWGNYELHPGYAASENIFSRRTRETLRILHEDDVHFRLLIWNHQAAPPAPEPRMRSGSPSHSTQTPFTRTPSSPTQASTPAPSIPPQSTPIPSTPAPSTAPQSTPTHSTPSPCTPTSSPPPTPTKNSSQRKTCASSNMHQTQPSMEPSTMTRKRSRDTISQKINVKITNVPLSEIVDRLVNKRRKR